MDNSCISLIRGFAFISGKHTSTNAHLQAGGCIRDVRRQACNRYRAATLCRAAPCCYGG